LNAITTLLEQIVFFIEQTAIAWYIFLAIGVFVYWWRWRSARRAYRSTRFELERDFVGYRIGGAVMMMVLLAEAFVIVVGIQNVVVPTLREDRALRETPDMNEGMEDGIFETPTLPRPSGVVVIPVPQSTYDPIAPPQDAQIILTPTAVPTDVGTIVPNPPDSSGCLTDNARLHIPANGMRVFQPIRVNGTAFVENFATYKIELSGPGTLHRFVVLDEGTIPLEEMGTLSQFNPAPYESGEYLFRLTVFDATTMMKAHCQVTIYITEPIPTSTPIGG
jgi:hypothetical protein